MSKYHYLLNYIVLGIILIGGVVSFVYLKGNQSAQLLIGIATSVAYACWGILYHWMDHSLHRKVVMEYILIAAIAIMVLLMVIRL
jgi:hypothetical protein